MDTSIKKALVLGAAGFIGGHLVSRLKKRGYYVEGVDIKYPQYGFEGDVFHLHDLREDCDFGQFDEVYQLAADMGGAGYIFTGEHDADVMHNSAQINLNVAEYFKKTKTKIFYSSSACIYPAYNQTDPNNPNCAESSAYPAAPDSEYGWEKLFSERLYMSYHRNYGLDVRIARFHNIFGEKGTWQGGKEKAPAAICRKVIEAEDEIEIWGDGEQTRSFLYIEECLDGIEKLMQSDYREPLNIGSDEMVTINQLAEMAMEFKGKKLQVKHVPGALGVRGRNSDNTLIEQVLGWKPTKPLKEGLYKTYLWITSQKSAS